MQEETKSHNNGAPAGPHLVAPFPEGISENKNNLGLWSEGENMQYMVFLYRNKTKFACRLKKR
jgi:hypothetical protein